MSDLVDDTENINDNDNHRECNDDAEKNVSNATSTSHLGTTRDSNSRLIRVRRQSMEQLDLIKVFYFHLCFYFLQFSI